MRPTRAGRDNGSRTGREVWRGKDDERECTGMRRGDRKREQRRNRKREQGSQRRETAAGAGMSRPKEASREEAGEMAESEMTEGGERGRARRG